MELLDFLADRWWLIFFIGPAIGGAATGIGKALERRRRDRFELERMRLEIERDARLRGEVAPQGSHQTSARAATPVPVQADVERVLAAHDAVSRRWLDHELDAAKLIDYPLMTDMREQLTRDFHRAKRRADALRPDDVRLLQDPARLAEYRDAVHAFEDAFDVALAEARRRAQRDFTDAERRRLQTARQLVTIAVDEAATAAERQSAYRRARAELDGLIVLPDATTDRIEQRIAGALER